jgi:thioredoxin 2
MERNSFIIYCTHCGRRNRVPGRKLQDNPVCGSCHRPLEIRPEFLKPLDVGEADFPREVLHHPGPVLAAFWSPRCPYSRQLLPLLDETAAGHGGRVKVVRIDTDRNPATASLFSIEGVPTVILFREGRAVKRMVGVLSLDEIERSLKAVL